MSASKGRVTGRRGGFALPSLPLPAIAAAAGLALVAGLVWFFFLRSTPPELLSITPLRVEPGKSVTLAGRHFGRDAAANTVLFGAQRAEIRAASATELTVLVPAGAKSKIAVSVQTSGGRSKPVLLEISDAANATAVEPDVAMPGQTVLVKGEGFAGQKASVFVGGTAASAVEATAEGLRVTLPPLAVSEGTRTAVVVQSGDKPARSFDLVIGRLPLVLEVVPKRAALGDQVVLKGRGFAADPHANAVTFAGQPTLVLAATPRELRVVVPAPPPGEISPDMPIVVSAGGRASTSTATLTFARSSGSGFVPRFFAAPVTEFPGEGLVFVNTEIGPLLLLGGPAEEASTAARAVKVASALNAFVANAASRPLAFELRERPQPSVAVVGEVRPFLTPTPQDLAAYAKAWDGGRGHAVAAAALARHWAALLQDYLGLFLYRQRPLQLLTFSSRGKVLSEIYGEASRRAPGGNNVPTSVVLPTTTTMAAALRAMALVVGAESARATVAIEGRWDGTIEDPDLGTRRFQLQLRGEGGRLGGEITTWRGKVELKSPLREAGFDRGVVRFTTDQQGTAFRFKGTLEGNAVSGTIERAGKPAVRFSMQYVD